MQNPKRLNDSDLCTARISRDFTCCMCKVKKLSIKRRKSKMKQLRAEFRTYLLFVHFGFFVFELNSTFPCERWWVINSCSCCLRSKRQGVMLCWGENYSSHRWWIAVGPYFYNPDFGKRETQTQQQKNWGARTESILEWLKDFWCATASQM